MALPELRGRIKLGGDKSLSHRLLMLAALAGGRSVIRNLAAGRDVAATREVLERLGVPIQRSDDSLTVTGCSRAALTSPSQRLYCGNSGTTLRMSLGLLAGSNLRCELTGDQSLNRRPIKRVLTPLRQMGAELQTPGDVDHPPVVLQGRPLQGITYHSPVASGQVKSAVLLAALDAEGATSYSEPALSRDHTERLLQHLGVDIQTSDQGIKIHPFENLRPFEYDVPGDISTAMFFAVAALLLPRSETRISNVLLNSTRTGAIDILQEMGANITIADAHSVCNELVGDLIVRHSQLRSINASSYSSVRYVDEVPILAVAAAFAQGETRLAGLAELRVKESDRLQGIVDILAGYGCTAQVQEDTLTIQGGPVKRLAEPQHHGDHRLAMALEILELSSSGRLRGEYQDIIAISAPEFYHTLQKHLI